MPRKITRQVGKLQGTGKILDGDTVTAEVSYDVTEYMTYIVFPEEELEGHGSRKGTISVISGNLSIDSADLYLQIMDKGSLKVRIICQSFSPNTIDVIRIICSGDFIAR